MQIPPGRWEILAWEAVGPWSWPGEALGILALATTFTRTHRPLSGPFLLSAWCATVALTLIGFTAGLRSICGAPCGLGFDGYEFLTRCYAPFLPLGILSAIVWVRGSIWLQRPALPTLLCLVGACLPAGILLFLTTPVSMLRSLLP